MYPNLHLPTKVMFAYIDEPPFASPSPNGEPTGCDVDLALTALQAIGVQQIETRLVTFTELIPGVAEGRWTMNTGLFVTAERSTVVEFSRPIWALSDGFIVRADTTKPPISYATLAADSTAQLGVVQATVQRHTALQAGIPNERIVEYATQDQAVAGLLAGQVDAYASTALGHRAYVRQAADTRLAVVDAVVAPLTEVPTMPPIGAFSFAKAERGLRQAVDTFLKSYLGSPAHRRLMRAYGFTDADIDWVAAPHP